MGLSGPLMPIFDLVLIAILVVVIVVTVVVIHAVILENAKAILDNGNNKADINDVAFEIIVSFGVGIVIISCFFGFIFFCIIFMLLHYFICIHITIFDIFKLIVLFFLLLLLMLLMILYIISVVVGVRDCCRRCRRRCCS